MKMKTRKELRRIMKVSNNKTKKRERKKNGKGVEERKVKGEEWEERGI